MRILHVLDHSLPLHSGYTFRTRAIMRAQVEKGWTVAGLTGERHYQHGIRPDVPDEIVEGLHFFRTQSLPSGPPVLREWGEVRALSNRIIALHREKPFDLIHAHSPVLNGLAGLRAAKKLGVPFVYEIRAFWEDAAVGNGTGTEGSVKYRATKAIETRVVRQADAVAVICEGLRSDLIARGIDSVKIMVSPNGVDMHMFGDPPPRDDALAAQLGLSGGDVIGFIGSFYDYEGIDDLIAAMPALVAARPNAHLLLVGGGPMEAALKTQAASSSAAARIHFIGRVPHHEVERYYSLIDILAYPRKKMRLTDLVTPLKPLEAMAQGKLVAASDVGGHRELIEDGVTGTLFAADDPAAIAHALSELLADRSGWDHRRAVARKFVETDRNWSSNISRYEPVYRNLVAGCSGGSR
jgi:PEP-CTERM/exosortase A-associated glycosyltransferase